MKSPQHIRDDLQASYNAIAQDFSSTRKHAWPEFRYFSQFIPKGAKVLDLGCGNGRLYEALKKREIDYTGLDFSQELTTLAKKRYPKQDFVVQDMTKLDLERRFDVIISIAAFHHIPGKQSRVKTLKLIFDHLEDDGVLMLSVWNLWQWKYWKAHLCAWRNWLFSFFRHDPRDLNVPFGKKKIPRYYHAFLPFELRGLLKKAGFRVEQSKVSGFNYLFVCRKHMASSRSHPLFIDEKVFAESLGRNPAHGATCNRNS